MVRAADVRPLYEREPCSLLFGAWDSHRKGRWPRFARLYSAVMFGLDPVAGRRMGGRMDPVNLTGSVEDSSEAEAGVAVHCRRGQGEGKEAQRDRAREHRSPAGSRRGDRVADPPDRVDLARGP